jgi:hypothetical protein
MGLIMSKFILYRKERDAIAPHGGGTVTEHTIDLAYLDDDGNEIMLPTPDHLDATVAIDLFDIPKGHTSSSTKISVAWAGVDVEIVEVPSDEN